MHRYCTGPTVTGSPALTVMKFTWYWVYMYMAAPIEIITAANTITSPILANAGFL